VLPEARYRFQHDAAPQRARHLEEARRRRHFQIGQLLLDTLDPAQRRERVVEVFEHLSYGLDQVRDPAQRRDYARLGLDAGRAALRGLAFDAAHEMLTNAARLLGDDPWQAQRELALDIHTALAECAFAQERADDFEREISLLTANARSPWETARAYACSSACAPCRPRYAEAVDACVRWLDNWACRCRAAEYGAGAAACPARDPGPARQRPLAFETAPEMQRPRPSRGGAPASACRDCRLYLPSPTCSAHQRHRLAPVHARGRARGFAVPIRRLGAGAVRGAGADRAVMSSASSRRGRSALWRRRTGQHRVRGGRVRSPLEEPLRELAEILYQDWDRLRRAGDERAVLRRDYPVQRLLSGVTWNPIAAMRRPWRTWPRATSRISSTPSWPGCSCVALREPHLPADLSGDWFDVRRYAEFERTRNTVQIAMSFVAAGIFDFLAGAERAGTAL
jgi:hypothetical protein